MRRLRSTLTRTLSQMGEGLADKDISIADCTLHSRYALVSAGVNGMRNKRRRSLSLNLLFTICRFQRSLCCIILTLSSGIFLPVFSSLARAELVDRVVASVNNEVITLSELERAVGFNVAFGGKKEDKLRTETLEGLINRHLLIQEAYRLKFVEVSDQDINAEIEKLKIRLGSDDAFAGFLARLDSTREQLGRMLGERLLVEKFIEKKIGLYVRVSRDEARDYFNNHPVEFKDKRFQEAQKTIMATLTDQKLEQQAAQYLAELRSKADIRLNP